MEKGRRTGKRAAWSTDLQKASVLGCCLGDVRDMCPPKIVLSSGGMYKNWKK